jgi:hypothetical protein
MRIIVLGYIVRGPIGGMVWHHLQYLAGLLKMGHDVYFMEDSDDYESCYDPARDAVCKDPSYGLSFLSGALQQFGLEQRWAYFDAHTNRWHGPCGARALDLFRTADLSLDVSGVNPTRDWTLYPPHRALIDTDPVFTQVRHLLSPASRQAAATHTAFFTFAENIGKPECSVPDDGIAWMPTRQPVLLDAWQPTPGEPGGNFTTVMQWESYPAVSYGGRTYATKSASFPPYLDLPARAGACLEIALGSPNAPRDHLHALGWIVRNPLTAIPDAWSFQQYIQRSKAEFSVAKHGYVVSNSGWFSERSTGYLASGRPVVTQNTGFTDWIPCDSGLLAFDSPESAIEAIARVNRDYHLHCRGARVVAEEAFESSLVLGSLLERSTG